MNIKALSLGLLLTTALVQPMAQAFPWGEALYCAGSAALGLFTEHPVLAFFSTGIGAIYTRTPFMISATALSFLWWTLTSKSTKLMQASHRDLWKKTDGDRTTYLLRFWHFDEEKHLCRYLLCFINSDNSKKLEYGQRKAQTVTDAENPLKNLREHYNFCNSVSNDYGKLRTFNINGEIDYVFEHHSLKPYTPTSLGTDIFWHVHTDAEASFTEELR